MPKKCLFVLPRFHTNLAVAVNEMCDLGWNVRIFVSYIVPGEDHSRVKPELFNDSKAIEEEIRLFSPDISFVRFSEGISRPAIDILIEMRLLVFAYCLFPASKAPSPQLLNRYTSGHPEVTRISPVKGPATKQVSANSRYLPWPVSIGEYHPPTRKSDPKKIILVGKLNQERKNQVSAIKFLESLDLSCGIEITLVGNGAQHNAESNFDYYKEIYAQSSAKPYIKIIENISHPEMQKLYSQNDFCILPAFHEPLGISPLEAMGTGCIPLVSTQCGSAYEISFGINGLIFDPSNLDSLTKPLLQIISNDYILSRTSINAYEYALKHLSPQKFISRLDKLVANN